MSTPMIPTAPECGAPGAEFEALAHINAQLRAELGAVRAGSARVCRELRSENAALRAAGDEACNVMDALRERADRVGDDHAVRALLGARNKLRAALAAHGMGNNFDQPTPVENQKPQ